MKHYSKEFKEEALKLSDDVGVKKAAQQLGIAYYTLADWRSIRRNTPPAKTLSAEEQSIRLRIFFGSTLPCKMQLILLATL